MQNEYTSFELNPTGLDIHSASRKIRVNIVHCFIKNVPLAELLQSSGFSLKHLGIWVFLKSVNLLFRLFIFVACAYPAQILHSIIPPV